MRQPDQRLPNPPGEDVIMETGDLGPLIERLIRIETKQDVAISQSADHEARIRSLESRLWIQSGFAAAVGLAASYIVPQLMK